MKRRLLAMATAAVIGLGALGSAPAVADSAPEATVAVHTCRPLAQKVKRLQAEFRRAKAKVGRLQHLLRRAEAAEAPPHTIRRIHNALDDATARARRVHNALENAKSQLRRCLAA